MPIHEIFYSDISHPNVQVRDELHLDSGVLRLDLTGTNAIGDTYFRNINGIIERLGIGGEGQVYTVEDGIPAWKDAVSAYMLPVATTSLLGGVMIGSGLNITSEGLLSAAPQPWSIITDKPNEGNYIWNQLSAVQQGGAWIDSVIATSGKFTTLNVTPTTNTIIHQNDTPFIRHHYGARFLSIGNQAYGNGTSLGTVLIGTESGTNLTESNGRNVAIGSHTLHFKVSGIRNIAVGHAAGLNDVSGSDNVFIGASAGRSLRTGSKNIFLGSISASVEHSDGSGVINSNNSVYLGNDIMSNVGMNAASFTNVIMVGNNLSKTTNSGSLSNTTIIGNNITTDLSNVIIIGNLQQEILLTNLSGMGDRMVVADAAGVLKTLPIPSGADGSSFHTSISALNGNIQLTSTNGAPTISVNATGTWTIDVSGNAATVSNGVYTTGRYSNPVWISQLDVSKITGLATVATSGSYNDLLNKPDPYSLPIASNTALGGFKVGNGLSIAGDGTLSVNPITDNNKYVTGVSVTGSNTKTITLSFNDSTSISTNFTDLVGEAGAPAYTLPVASATTLGGIKVGNNLSISADGTLSATGDSASISLPPGQVAYGTGSGVASSSELTYTGNELALGGSSNNYFMGGRGFYTNIPDAIGNYGGYALGYGSAVKWMYGISKNYSNPYALVFYEDGLAANARMALLPGGQLMLQALAGSGTRMVVADSSGNLSTQAIPTDGGSVSAGYEELVFGLGAGNGVSSNSKFRIGNTPLNGTGITIQDSLSGRASMHVQNDNVNGIAEFRLRTPSNDAVLMAVGNQQIAYLNPYSIGFVSAASGGFTISNEHAAGFVNFVVGGNTSFQERMRITNEGKVLVGYTASQGDYSLQVGGNAFFGGKAVIGHGVNTLTPNTMLSVRSEWGNAHGLIMEVDAVNNGVFAGVFYNKTAGSSTLLAGGEGAGKVFSAENGSGNITLLNSGNAQIGYTSGDLGYKLQVGGNVWTNGSITATGITAVTPTTHKMLVIDPATGLFGYSDIPSGATGSVASVAASISGALSVSGSPITTSGTLAFTWQGNTSQYVRGDGSLQAFPTIPTQTSQLLNNSGFINSVAHTHSISANGKTANFTEGQGFTIVGAGATSVDLDITNRIITITSTDTYGTGGGGVVINNDADNRLVTAMGNGQLQAEAGLTWDGSTFKIETSRTSGYEPFLLVKAGKSSGQAAAVAYQRSSSDQQTMFAFETGSSSSPDGYFGTMPNETQTLNIISGTGGSNSTRVIISEQYGFGVGTYQSPWLVGVNKAGELNINNPTDQGDYKLQVGGNIWTNGTIRATGIQATSSSAVKMLVYDTTTGDFFHKDVPVAGQGADGNSYHTSISAVNGTIQLTSNNGAGTLQVDASGNWNINAATVTNGVYATGSYSNPSWITALDWGKISNAPTNLNQFINGPGYITSAAHTHSITANGKTTNFGISEGFTIVGSGATTVDLDIATRTITISSTDTYGTGGSADGNNFPTAVLFQQGILTISRNNTTSISAEVNLSHVGQVNINNALDGQILRYNNAVAKWENWTPNFLTSYEADLANTYVGVGNSSGKLSGTNNLTYDGTALNINGVVKSHNLLADRNAWSFDVIKAPGLYHYDNAFGGTSPNSSPNFRTIEIGNSGRYTQVAFPYDSDNMYFRRQTDAAWGAWNRVVIENGGLWNISSRQVLWSAPENGSYELVKGYMAGNDWSAITMGGAFNQGYLEISTGDDGTEPIYIRQYFGTSVQRTLTLLDENGATTIPSLAGSGDVSIYADNNGKLGKRPFDTMVSIGDGASIYKGKTGNQFEIKSVKAGDGVTITEQQGTITISSLGSGSGEWITSVATTGSADIVPIFQHVITAACVGNITIDVVVFDAYSAMTQHMRYHLRYKMDYGGTITWHLTQLAQDTGELPLAYITAAPSGDRITVYVGGLPDWAYWQTKHMVNERQIPLN